MLYNNRIGLAAIVAAVTIVATFAIGKPAMAGQSNSSFDSDSAAIVAAARDYALGVADHNVARIERAFAMDQAQLKLVLEQDGKPVVFVIPIRDLMEKIWLKMPKSPDHFVEVINLNVIEGRYATIVVNNNNDFLDQLSLYKINGRWRIVDKLAMRHPDAPPSSVDLVEIFGNQTATSIGMKGNP